MLGPFATASRRTPIHQMSLPVLSSAACASMFRTTTTDNDNDNAWQRGPPLWPHGMGPITNAACVQHAYHVLYNACYHSSFAACMRLIIARPALTSSVARTVVSRLRPATEWRLQRRRRSATVRPSVVRDLTWFHRRQLADRQTHTHTPTTTPVIPSQLLLLAVPQTPSFPDGLHCWWGTVLRGIQRGPRQRSDLLLEP